jgi:CheY-like chemotaxis protein
MASVLIVEDEISLRELVADALVDFGHEATLAENGVVAMEKLKARKFDFVVSDVSMPEGVSGIELAQQVILVSGHARAQLPPLPANVAFLPKPYRIHQLLEMFPAA